MNTRTRPDTMPAEQVPAIQKRIVRACRQRGLPVIVAEDPLTCVVRGCGMALEKMEKLVGIFTDD